MRASRPRRRPAQATVAAAVKRDLADIAKRDPKLAKSSLAASALVLAAQLDDPGNSATSKSLCARALSETMDKLRELAPTAIKGDKLDELGNRRATRLGRRTAAS